VSSGVPLAMMRSFRLPARLSILLTFAASTVLLAACADGGGMPNMPRWGGFGGGQQRAAPPPQPAQQAAQAAPSEVLLACTQAAATRFGGPPGSITPSASSLIRPDTFRVDLTSTTGPIVCLADRGGNILSVEKTAPTQPQSTGQAQNPRLL
jgi:hypothetical protein